jgi:hypothetical protein
MPNEDHTATETDLPTDIAPRTRRARTEVMDIALVRVGVYAVHSESGGQYEVDVVEKSCTCPDWRDGQPSGGCKHMRRVNLDIQGGCVPRPDGRLPTTTVADGGRSVPPVSPDARAPAERISGPHWEYDRYGDSTGVTFYRCEVCGTEALRRLELLREPCCER